MIRGTVITLNNVVINTDRPAAAVLVPYCSVIMDCAEETGRFGVVSPRVEDNFTLLSLPEDIYAQAVLNKPSIKAAQFRLEGAAKSIRIAQSSWYPQLNFGAGIGTNYYNISGVENASFSSQWHQKF